MVTLNTLKPAEGSNKKTVRIGRGQGSGNGKTAGRGSNGLYSRRGSTHRLYFEGGQTPLTRRVPKRGFNNIFRVEYQTVNVSAFEKLDIGDTVIDAQWLATNGLIHSAHKPVKILGDGELTKAISVKADKFSKSAREKIEKAKGKAEVVSC